MSFLRPDTPDPARLGSKGAALARLGEMGFEIPAWFAVPPEAAWTAEERQSALDELGAGPSAVRSSGTMGDGAGHSFAGQFESHLDLSAARVAGKIAEVRASAGSESILTYCRESGLPAPSAPSVLVQRTIAPRCAGVAFSADPVSGKRAGPSIVAQLSKTPARPRRMNPRWWEPVPAPGG
jgi:phosphoenolpyruvate synthase/pyruvate phosphate dikinase